jgi:hypothetical protein
MKLNLFPTMRKHRRKERGIKRLDRLRDETARAHLLLAALMRPSDAETLSLES